jgi:hypothetical protein
VKKTIRKLMVRSETIRALRALDNRDLARAIGGDEAVAYESGKVNCPAPAVVVATAACG